MPGISGTGAVTRSTLRQQIADALRDEVLAGRLEPGREFTVKEIAEQYGVSATPVREALVDLSAQGLLEADQHRGFRVREYSAADFREMIEARALVTDSMFRALAAAGGARHGEGAGGGDGGADGESGAGAGSGLSARAQAFLREVPGPRTAAVLAGVRRRGEEAQRAATAGDLTVLIGYDLRFWRELSALYGNAHLGDFLHRLRVQSWVCAVQHLRRLGDLRGVLWCGHTELVDALVQRDIPAARALVAAYNTHALALVERLSAG
ncbi:GntR family transcriptional regulator [Streptomyces sp. NPDC006743]|uniref:GntR family transcriptional regulator n=1 Tax=Streptomyces sp. NPDC006743 TaxID=3154480 RepID=UPI003456785C